MAEIRRALVLASALLMLPALVRAGDPYADFRVPPHRAFSWFVGAQGSTNSFLRGTDSQLTREDDASGQVQSDFSWTSESEARERNLVCDLISRLDHGHNRLDFAQPTSTTDGSGQRQTGQQTLSVGAGQRSYLGSSEFAIELQATSVLDFEQSRSSQAQRSVSGTFQDFGGSEFRNDLYRQTGSVSVGVGRGRVRDVSGVYSAQLIEQRLAAVGRLAHALSPGARLRLAQLHYIRRDFSAAHARASRYFWREAERILRADGALADSTLDAYALLRILEPAFSTLQVFRRSAGGYVRPYVFGSETRGHEDQDQHNSRVGLDNGTPVLVADDRFSSRTHLDRKDSGVGLSAEYHRPVGMRWQWDAVAGVSYGGGSRHELSVNSSAQLQYLIADRWFASAGLQHQLRSLRADGVRTEPAWIFNGLASLSYLVEDSWSLDLNCSTLQAQDRNRDLILPSFQRSTRTSIGLTYRPAGRFDAPGLGISERLTTPPL